MILLYLRHWSGRAIRAASALALALPTVVVASAVSHAATTAFGQWHRSMLAYHDANRSAVQWQKHLMAVGASGAFTGQWLFDAAVLTAVDYNGKDLMYGGFTGDELNGVLNDEFADAAALDAAATTLTATYGAPPAPIQVSIGVPWLSPRTTSLTLPGTGTVLNLSVPAQRVQAADWYLDQIKARAQAANWKHLSLFGAYYHREEIIDGYNDPAYVTQFNADAHSRGMKTVWVPYYGAPHMWDTTALGFDVSNVQPSVAFRGPQYGGVASNGQLYTVGQESQIHHQAFEYESSTAGESKPENWLSHQYLAVEQYFGTDAYPQIFFAGLRGDMFDAITTQATAAGDRWWCYSDLVGYLAGQSISNMEIGLPWPTRDLPDGTRQVQWTAPADQQLWAVRMDFTDGDPTNPWRGRLSVRVDGPGGSRSSYAQRAGEPGTEPYQSLEVPLTLAPDGANTVSTLTITLSKEATSPWPNIQRVVAERYIVPLIASGAAEELSSSTYQVQDGIYPDNAPTYQGFAKGKLTDGLVSPNGSWYWSGVMGWNQYDGAFAVTIDLQQVRDVGEVDLITHHDATAGIGWPTNVSALVGLHSPARTRGITTISDQAVGTSGDAVLTTKAVTSTEDSGTISMKLNNVPGRFVTVTGTESGWFLLDEVQVKDGTGTIVSTGCPYTISPKPSVIQGDQTLYGDSNSELTDSAIVPYFRPQYSYVLDGIPSATGGTAQVTWVTQRPARTATIWFTNPSQQYGVILPPGGTAQWRDQNGNWSTDNNVVLNPDGAAPHATMILPFDSQVTGVRAVLPPTTGSSGWYMISQITVQ